MFHFTINSPTITVLTKRTILSTIAKLFDSSGLISSIIIKAKIFIQKLWCIKLDWDDPLPSSIFYKWTDFVDNLTYLSKLIFPRWIGFTSDSVYIELGFCDASQHAFAAVVYIRSTTIEGVITSSLMCSKTKVAPLKKLTIPRLELSGAVLLTKLIIHTLDVLELKNVPIYLWTDSSITYTWINNHLSRWKNFVFSNRVCFIQTLLLQAIWKFVLGIENPADCAT